MNKEKLSSTYSMRKWTDIIDKIVIDRIFGAIEEKRRLVGTGLYTEQEFLELCNFTGYFSCDYANRFLWCKKHNMIEYRGRSTWSTWWHDSPVDHILTVYGENDINVKGYKNKKHVLELHFSNLNSWNDYKTNVIDKFRLMTKNPEFIGRRDINKGINWIGDGTGLFCPTSKTILEDEPIVE